MLPDRYRIRENMGPASSRLVSHESTGLGTCAGITNVRPGNLKQINQGFLPMFPNVHTLPAQRLFVDHRKYVSATEVTIPESLAFP
jgi:hypothetical protein